MKIFQFASVSIVALLVSMGALAQSSRVPAVVVEAFQRSFPQASDVEWEVKGEVFEVEFELDRLDHEVWMNAQGEIVRHQQDLRTRSVPESVRTGVRQHYPGYRITEAEKLQTGKETVYKLELSRWFKDLDVIVDEQGQVVPGFIW